MKCKLKNEEDFKYYGLMNKLFIDDTYEVISIEDNYCTILNRNNIFSTIYKDLLVEAFDFTYEVGDVVEITKIKIDNCYDVENRKKELGKVFVINAIYNDIAEKDFSYELKNSDFLRCKEELEIIKTKYQLEEEKKGWTGEDIANYLYKNIPITYKNRDENKSGIVKNTNKHNFTVSNADITVKEKDSDKVLFKGSVATPIINHNIKAKEYKEGDVLKVTDGKYKGLEGTFVAYVEAYDKILIKLDELNAIYVNSINIMLIKKKVNNTHKTETRIINLDLRSETNNIALYKGEIKVKFSKNKIVVILEDGIKGTARCCSNDSFDEEKGIKIALFRALLNQNDNKNVKLEREIGLLNTRVELAKKSLDISNLEKEAYNKQLQSLIN